MANITLHTANRNTGDVTWLAQYYGAQTATKFEVLDDSGGLRYASTGVNFTYYSGFFNSGTVTSENFFSSSGSLTATITGMDVNVSTRNNLLNVGTSDYDYGQYAGRGDDNFLGSDGDDKVTGSKGNDAYDGGKGIDVLTFKGFVQGVTVNLSAGTATTGYGTSSVLNIEDLEGSSYADLLTGNSSNNSLQGFGGNDTINGGSGTDTVAYGDATYAVNVNLTTGIATGGSGSDTLTSIERIIGSRFDDTLVGSAAADTFQGGFGNDNIDGSGGIDTVQYGNVGSGVVVNLTTGVVSGGGGADTLAQIENVTGSIFADTLIGNAAANILNGSTGNDVLDGKTGADVMLGGAGSDTYYVDNTGDKVYETTTTTGTLNAGGTDKVNSAITFNLSLNTGVSFVENLTLTGSARINGTGNALSNTITGNAASNMLTGGVGGDKFVFNTKLGATNIDTLTDFKVSGADKVLLDDDIFLALGIAGTTAGAALTASKFQLGTLANDAGDRIIYDQTLGKLYYDADGTGATAQVQIALIGASTHAALAATDFLVIA